MINHYLIALFLHIAGALGFFMALGLEWTSVRQLRRARYANQVRDWLSISTGAAKVGMPSMVLLLISGALMMVSAWGAVAWIMVTLGALVLLIAITVALSRRRMAAIGRALEAEDGVLSSDLRQLIQHPLLWLGMKLRVAIALGIVFLMSVKPDLNGSLLTIAIAIVLGLLLGLPMWGRERIETEPAA